METMTTRQIADMVRTMLEVRAGELLTPEVIRERANNIGEAMRGIAVPLQEDDDASDL